MSDRVRDAFEVLIERMEDPPTWEEVRVPATRPREIPRKRHPILIAASALAAMVIVGILAVNLLSRPLTYQLPTPDMAAGEVRVSEDPLVVRGTPSPEPRFDTSTLGDEVEMSELEDVSGFVSWADQAEFPGGDLSKVIVAGGIDMGASAGMAVVVPRDAAKDVEWCILTLTQSGTTCATASDFQTPVYLIRHPEPLTSTPGTFGWGPAPERTSVVTLSYGDTQLWQQPVSGIVLFPIDTSTEPFVITALDQDGNEIYTDMSIDGLKDLE